MGMLPGPMIEPNMPVYAAHIPYGIGASNGYQSSYNMANTFTGMNSFENASNFHATRMNNGYDTDLLSGPTSAPTSAPRQAPRQFQQTEIDYVPEASGGSNDSDDSDEEYRPGSSRKRRRQH